MNNILNEVATAFETQTLFIKLKKYKNVFSAKNANMLSLHDKIEKHTVMIHRCIEKRSKIKVKDLWQYQNRLFRKILSHTVGVFLNQQNGNKALRLALLADV